MSKRPRKCPKCGELFGWRKIDNPADNPINTGRIPIGAINAEAAKRRKSEVFYGCKKCGYQQRYDA